MTVAAHITAEHTQKVDAITQEHIDHVRQHVSTEFRDLCDERTVHRFIRATGGNLHQAAKRLQATLTWRAELKPETIVCKACAKDPRSHYMHVSCYDLLNRPVIYSCNGLASNKTYEDNHDHMISTFETAIKLMPPGVEQWVWVCDFHGFGMRDINVKLAKLFLDVSADHYPERLGLFLVVDAPKLFNVLWSAIEAWVDRKTHKKIRFLPFDFETSKKKGHVGKLEHELSLHFDPASVQWILQEMVQNRDHKAAAQKVYSMQQLQQLAKDQVLVKNAEVAACHNCHGMLPLLERYQADPTLLEPQASCVA